jgi:hypothetical protein
MNIGEKTKMTTMDIKQKRALFHKLLWNMGALESKGVLLAQYNVTSTTELTETQLDEVIRRLQKGAEQRYTSDDVKQWRSNVLTQLNHCGVYVTNNDWDAVNRFLLNPKISGKLMYEMSIPELKVLHKKLISIAAKVKSKRERELLTMNLN